MFFDKNLKVVQGEPFWKAQVQAFQNGSLCTTFRILWKKLFTLCII